jgi:malate synthase
VPVGTFRATVLIETLPAAFQMEEILYELRERSLGLNCGRWDYIFSFIKRQAGSAAAVVPDRAALTMDRGFLQAYSQELIRVCHKRKAHAMGGMSAFIPIKGDPEANDRVLAKVQADKEREATAGHDGTWVAHPALVPVARAVFDRLMKGPNQIARPLPEAVSETDLLKVPEGPRTRAGVAQNVGIGIAYLESWLRGVGCVPIHNLMEDAATAEISRTQVWQQLRHGATFDDGPALTAQDLSKLIETEIAATKQRLGAHFEASQFLAAAELFFELCTSAECSEFITLPAYERVLAQGL